MAKNMANNRGAGSEVVNGEIKLSKCCKRKRSGGFGMGKNL